MNPKIVNYNQNQISNYSFEFKTSPFMFGILVGNESIKLDNFNYSFVTETDSELIREYEDNDCSEYKDE